jgi:hypothetical protein
MNQRARANNKQKEVGRSIPEIDRRRILVKYLFLELLQLSWRTVSHPVVTVGDSLAA